MQLPATTPGFAALASCYDDANDAASDFSIDAVSGNDAQQCEVPTLGSQHSTGMRAESVGVAPDADAASAPLHHAAPAILDPRDVYDAAHDDLPTQRQMLDDQWALVSQFKGLMIKDRLLTARTTSDLTRPYCCLPRGGNEQSHKAMRRAWAVQFFGGAHCMRLVCTCGHYCASVRTCRHLPSMLSCNATHSMRTKRDMQAGDVLANLDKLREAVQPVHNSIALAHAANPEIARVPVLAFEAAAHLVPALQHVQRTEDISVHTLEQYVRPWAACLHELGMYKVPEHGLQCIQDSALRAHSKIPRSRPSAAARSLCQFWCQAPRSWAQALEGRHQSQQLAWRRSGRGGRRFFPQHAQAGAAPVQHCKCMWPHPPD